MPPITLKKLVDQKIAKPKIDPDDTREVLEVIRRDSRFSTGEISQLRRLAALPASKFLKKDEYIPNPNDPEDGVTIKADPKRWITAELELATAQLTVRSTVPEVKLSLSKPKEYEVEDFGPHLARSLDISVKGKKLAEGGTIDFSYGSRNVSVAVKKGEALSRVVDRIIGAVQKKEGIASVRGSIDDAKSGTQTVHLEVL